MAIRPCTIALAMGLLLFVMTCRTEAQTGGNWTLRMPAAMPPAGQVAMAYDSARGVTVLFRSGSQTWEWDGINRTPRQPAMSPSSIQAHAMAYDSARHVTVLFGGMAPGSANNETWEWD